MMSAITIALANVGTCPVLGAYFARGASLEASPLSRRSISPGIYLGSEARNKIRPKLGGCCSREFVQWSGGNEKKPTFRRKHTALRQYHTLQAR